MKIEEFLSPDQEKNIADAIAQAELGTTGEIRVHIEKKCKSDPLHRAIEIFSDLKMHETRFSNAVIIYIAVDDHKLSIYGDSGINEVVDENFWNEDISIMIEQFKRGHYEEGIVQVISRIGEKLKDYFPSDGDENPNEIDNSVSYGGDQ